MEASDHSPAQRLIPPACPPSQSYITGTGGDNADYSIHQWKPTRWTSSRWARHPSSGFMFGPIWCPFCTSQEIEPPVVILHTRSIVEAYSGVVERTGTPVGFTALYVVAWSVRATKRHNYSYSIAVAYGSSSLSHAEILFAMRPAFT